MASPAGILLARVDFGIILNLTLLAVTYIFVLIVYRIFLSPLAKVPGPKLAAATGWYEFYYDCLCAGKYIFEIEKLHEQFGWHLTYIVAQGKPTYIVDQAQSYGFRLGRFTLMTPNTLISFIRTHRSSKRISGITHS